MSRRRTPWQKSSHSGRRIINRRNRREKILIVCEGKKTEPNYFKNFPVDKKVVKLNIHGTGRNTDSLVEEVLGLKEAAEKNGKPYNQIWCVFDKDSFSKQNFNRAIQLASAHKIKIAYSNEAFEIWFLLHFDYFVDAASRRLYKSRLTRHLGYAYKKNNKDIYNELLDKQEIAIKNSKKLLFEYSEFNPAENNPSTTVHYLVKELNDRLSDCNS